MKKQTIEIPQCDLDKKIEDYESRNNRIPEIDVILCRFRNAV